MMNTSENRMLFSADGAAALTQAFKREALVSFQSDIPAFVSLNHDKLFKMDIDRLIKIIVILPATTATGALH